MKLHIIGCSHHNSSADVRGRLAFSPVQAEQALARLRVRFPTTEAVLLSTCNRVEVYTASTDAGLTPTHQEVAEFLADFHGLNTYDIFDDLFERTGEDAVRHLFTVAASLDSMVIGEPQILAQVKQAYELAQARDCAGPLTHQVFQAAIRVAKRVATETAINEKRVSIPSVAVADFARGIFERFDDKQVLVIGAGEMAEETLEYLRDLGVRQITVVNRSPERAVALAEKWQGQAAPWDQLLAALAAADLVVSTTGATEPIINAATYREVEARRFQRDLFVLDLAMPRDFDPAIAEFPNVYLYGLDDLREACERNRQERDREWPRAMAIVEEETARFMADLNHRATAPIIRRLKDNWQATGQDELQRLFRKLPDLNERERAEIAQSIDRLVNKLLHPPLESLRDESKQGVPHALLEAFKQLFRLRD